MVFILFVVSLAVVGTILKRSDTPRGDAKNDWARDFYARQRLSVAVPSVAPVATDGLMALGRALEQQGRGEIPGRPKPSDSNADEVVRSG